MFAGLGFDSGGRSNDNEAPGKSGNVLTMNLSLLPLSSNRLTGRTIVLGAIALLCLLSCPAQIAGSVAAATSSSCADDLAASPVPTPDAIASPAPDQDLVYIDAMLGEHAQAIRLASSALERAEDSQVRRMALRVAESQAGEMQLLKAWRSAWYPAAAPFTVGTSASPLSECSTGVEFDRAFMETTAAYFYEASALLSEIAERAAHPELRSYAQQLNDARSTDIALIEAWLDAHPDQ